MFKTSELVKFSKKGQNSIYTVKQKKEISENAKNQPFFWCTSFFKNSNSKMFVLFPTIFQKRRSSHVVDMLVYAQHTYQCTPVQSHIYENQPPHIGMTKNFRIS